MSSGYFITWYRFVYRALVGTGTSNAKPCATELIFWFVGSEHANPLLGEFSGDVGFQKLGTPKSSKIQWLVGSILFCFQKYNFGTYPFCIQTIQCRNHSSPSIHPELSCSGKKKTWRFGKSTASAFRHRSKICPATPVLSPSCQRGLLISKCPLFWIIPREMDLVQAVPGKIWGSHPTYRMMVTCITISSPCIKILPYMVAIPRFQTHKYSTITGCHN